MYEINDKSIQMTIAVKTYLLDTVCVGRGNATINPMTAAHVLMTVRKPEGGLL
jgi:hypothetical protein